MLGGRSNPRAALDAAVAFSASEPERCFPAMLPAPKKFALLFSVIAIAGCDKAFTKKPTTSDLVGTYLLSKPSEAFLFKRKGYKVIPVSEIRLGADYSISIVNLPDCATNGFGKSFGAFLSGEGRFEVEKALPGWGLTLRIEKSDSLRGGVYAGPWVGIRGRSAPYRLEVTIGDPDSGETILYERKPS
jgi:hypothetical protein